MAWRGTRARVRSQVRRTRRWGAAEGRARLRPTSTHSLPSAQAQGSSSRRPRHPGPRHPPPSPRRWGTASARCSQRPPRARTPLRSTPCRTRWPAALGGRRRHGARGAKAQPRQRSSAVGCARQGRATGRQQRGPQAGGRAPGQQVVQQAQRLELGEAERARQRRPQVLRRLGGRGGGQQQAPMRRRGSLRTSEQAWGAQRRRRACTTALGGAVSAATREDSRTAPQRSAALPRAPAPARCPMRRPARASGVRAGRAGGGE